MHKNDFEYLICSDPDREKVFCEIYYKNEVIAEISQETEEFLLTLFSNQSGDWWEVSLTHFQNALEKAKNHLIGDVQ